MLSLEVVLIKCACCGDYTDEQDLDGGLCPLCAEDNANHGTPYDNVDPMSQNS